MASYPTERGRGSGGRAREGRGRRGFPDMRDNRGERSNYDLRNTSSDRYQRYEHTQKYSSEYQQGGRGTKETWKGNPKSKNTHIEYFWRTESPFSQFHPAIFDIQNERFVCAEQYMMWNKARVFSDHNTLRLIMQTQEPKTMKKYGRGVDNFDADIWDMCCRQIVQEGNTAKFSQNFALLEKMLSTENKYFAEASPGDRKWGIGMAENNPLSNNPDSWRGSNWLGEALNMVKYEFQLIIFVTMNGKRVIQAPKPSLFDLFKIGTCEYFEKMNCEILITHSEEEKFTDATAKPSKNRSGKGGNKKDKQAKIVSRVNEEEETLARNYDVQPPKSLKEKEQLNVEAKVLEKVTEKIDTAVESSKEKFAGDFEKIIIDQREEIKKEITKTNQKEMTLPNSGEEKMKENVQKAQEIPKESQQIDDSVSESQNCNEDNKTTTTVGNKQKQSPLTKRKYQSEQVYKQEKIKFEPTKITFGSIPVIKTKIPNSKRISCEYIFTDWARAKICSDVTILNCFMGLSVEDIHKFPGNCIYQTNNEVLAIGINISSLLVQLQKEFNGLRSIFQENSDVIKQFDCATNIPYPPSLKEKQRVDTETRDIWLLPSSQLDSPVVKNIKMRKKKSEISAKESAETLQEKSDISAMETAEVPQDITDTPAKESAEILQDITDTPAMESAEILQDITDTPAKESAEVPQDITDTPAKESAEIQQDITDTPAKESAEIQQDITDTPAKETAEVPQDITDTPAKESAEILQDITDTSAKESAEIQQDITDTPAKESAEILQDKSDTPAKESAEILQDITDTSAKESAEIQQDITDTPAKESAEIQQDKSDTSAKESAEILQDKSDTSAKESAEIPRDITDTPAKETAEVPQDKSDTSAKESAEILQDKSDTSAKESAEIPRDITDTPAKETAEVPQDKSDTSAKESAEILQDITDTPAKESAEIPQDITDTPAKESAEILQDIKDTPAKESAEVSQDKSDNAFEEVQITANKPDTKIAIIPVNPTTGTIETEDRAEKSTANKKPESEEEVISAGHTETGINKSDINASEMDVTPEFIPVTNTSSSLPDGEQIEEQKPKERCSYSGDETSTAKRLKQSTEAGKQLVSYDSSSDSDQASFENQNTRTEKIISKTGKKHSISEESTDNKRAKSEPLPEIKFPDENEINEKDDPKEKPIESISESSGKSKKKKKKKKIISSTPLH